MNAGRATKIHTVAQMVATIQATHSLDNCVLQALDLSKVKIDWPRVAVDGSLFLGCSFDSDATEADLRRRGATILQGFANFPYHIFRTELYTPAELMDHYGEPGNPSLDEKIYQHFLDNGGRDPDIKEALAQRIHDHAIDNALKELLPVSADDDPLKSVIGFMGGHDTRRGMEFYTKTAQLAQALTREGYFIVSGGGPGIMEAANLGAYLAVYTDADLADAIKTLAQAPDAETPAYLAAARAVLARFPKGGDSLSVPTWFYGFEKTNLFATKIAKYFSNSIREDGLVALGTAGVVFAPGGSGTREEVFMDALRNDYGAIIGEHIFYSPMVFLGTCEYQVKTGVYQVVAQLATANYKDMLLSSDEPAEIVAFLKMTPARKVPREQKS